MDMMLPLIAALLLLPVLLLGIVLFIVGLVKKKPAIWGSGIAIGVLGLLVLTVGAGMLMFLSVSKARTQMATQMQAMSVNMSGGFQETTGLALPNDVTLASQTSISSSDGSSGGQTTIHMRHMSVPSDFDNFLAANFTRAKWQEVAPTFQASQSADYSFLPSDTQLQAASLYSLTYQPDPNSPATFTTAIAHDANTQQAWMVSMEKSTSAE